MGGHPLISTTTYDHVGVVESLTGERLRPIHTWRLLRDAAASHAQVIADLDLVFDAHPPCRILLTPSPNLVAGRFTDNPAVARAVEQVIAERGWQIERRRDIRGDGGERVFELLDLSSCPRSLGASP